MVVVRMVVLVISVVDCFDLEHSPSQILLTDALPEVEALGDC